MNKIDKTAKIAETVKILGCVNIGKNVIIHNFCTLYTNVIIEDNVEIFEGSVIGRMPMGAKAVSRNVISSFKSVIIGKDSVISPNVVIYTDVIIGEGTLIGDSASIREGVRIGKNCLISRCVTINYNTKIGNFTKVMDLTHLTGNMIIGNNVFISTLVSTTNDNNIGKLNYDENKIKGPCIKDNVAIGAGANILPNVTIEEGAIVAAGSVVTKNVPSKTLVMGIPAKPIRRVE